jgi:hypothetical protein
MCLDENQDEPTHFTFKKKKIACNTSLTEKFLASEIDKNETVENLNKNELVIII